MNYAIGRSLALRIHRTSSGYVALNEDGMGVSVGLEIRPEHCHDDELATIADALRTIADQIEAGAE